MTVSEKFLFDQASVDALEKREKEWIAWDEGLAGFGVRILPSGTKSWIVSVKTTGKDGKARSRRRTIGRDPDMSLDEAKTKAREILGEAAGDGAPKEEPDGPQEEPAAEATAGPDRPVEPSPNDAVAEGESDAGVGAGTASAPVTSTGEVLPAGTGAWDPDEGLDIENAGQGPDAGRDPEAVPGGEADDNQTNAVLAGAIDKVTGAGTADQYEEVAETTGRADRSRIPRVEPEDGTGPGRGDEAGAAGGGPDGDVDDDEGGARDRGEVREEPDGRETAGSGPGRMGRTMKVVSETAGKVVKGSKALMSKKAEGSPAQEEPAKAARDEPESGPPAGGNVEAAEADGAEGSDAPKLEARQGTTAGVEGESRDGNRLSEDTVAGLARNLDEMRGVVDRIEAWNAKMGPQMEEMSVSAAVIATDRRQGRRRRARAVLAMAAVAAVGIAGGVALQSRVEVAPQADPTLGWKDHVWNYYGEAFMGCFERAEETESGYADCTIKVRAR